MTGFNTFLLTAATALVSLGAATIATNLIAGSVQVALGIICFIVYEKTPTSN